MSEPLRLLLSFVSGDITQTAVCVLLKAKYPCIFRIFILFPAFCSCMFKSTRCAFWIYLFLEKICSSTNSYTDELYTHLWITWLYHYSHPDTWYSVSRVSTWDIQHYTILFKCHTHDDSAIISSFLRMLSFWEVAPFLILSFFFPDTYIYFILNQISHPQFHRINCTVLATTYLSYNVRLFSFL